MKEIATDILIETEYEGVTVGAIRTPAGVVMVDTPINPKDASAWRTICTRTAVPDLTACWCCWMSISTAFQARPNIKCPVIVHEKTSQAVSSRPASKNQPYLPMGANGKPILNLLHNALGSCRDHLYCQYGHQLGG